MPKLKPLPYSDYSDIEVDVKYTRKEWEHTDYPKYTIRNRQTGEEIGIVYKVTSHSVGSRGEKLWRAEATNRGPATNRIESPTRDGATVYALMDYFENKYEGYSWEDKEGRDKE